jgi:hypothetical protein
MQPQCVKDDQQQQQRTSDDTYSKRVSALVDNLQHYPKACPAHGSCCQRRMKFRNHKKALIKSLGLNMSSHDRDQYQSQWATQTQLGPLNPPQVPSETPSRWRLLTKPPHRRKHLCQLFGWERAGPLPASFFVKRGQTYTQVQFTMESGSGDRL